MRRKLLYYLLLVMLPLAMWASHRRWTMADGAMSRANLYKKTQQMLGITPNEFLRNVRLKHAARLLADTSEPVNQISLMVGFQTPRYFSQCFRQMFGVTPSEYRSGGVKRTIIEIQKAYENSYYRWRGGRFFPGCQPQGNVSGNGCHNP